MVVQALACRSRLKHNHTLDFSVPMKGRNRAALLGPLIRVLVLVSYANAAYVWPNPQYEQLEGLFYEGKDLNGFPIATLTQDCVQRGGPESSTVAAEWLRLAYHDMATHNITDGTGGLDASVYYELDRGENIGAGNIQTMFELGGSSNKYISRADVIAMAAIWAVASCDGPVLPFRGGRVDALQAGRAGVPEPQQDLQTHTESFRAQGFNATEMIALVACGHTLGGVRNADFPTIVQPIDRGDPFDTNSNVHTFDSSRPFDHHVVTEYLDGSTQNPLVVNKNETVLSDLRIFSSDGNATVSSMQTLESFHQTCAPLLTRMLNTVPAGVSLTEEIAPIPFKVTKAEFTISKGKLLFIARVRVLETATPHASRDIRMFWCERRGPNGGCAKKFVMTATNPTLEDDTIVPSTFAFSPVSRALGLHFTISQFAVPVAFERSVGAFWFEVRDGGPNVPVSDVRIEDNGGKGYWAPDDEVVYVPVGLKVNDPGDVPFSDVGGSRPYYIAAGIHNSTTPVTAQVHLFDNTIVARSPTDFGDKAVFNKTLSLTRNESMASIAGYKFYTAEASTRGMAPTADFEITITPSSSGLNGGTDSAVGTQRKYLNFVRMIPAEIASLPRDSFTVAAISNTNLTLLSNGTTRSGDSVVTQAGTNGAGPLGQGWKDYHVSGFAIMWLILYFTWL